MTRSLAVSALALTTSIPFVYGQSAPPAAAFDVASVERHAGDVCRSGGVSVQPGGRFTAPSATVRELVAAAYDLQDARIVGGSEWLARDRFEAHVETRKLPVYVLVSSKEDRRPGPQLRPSRPECAPVSAPPRGVFAPGFVPAPPPPAEGGPLMLDAMSLGCPSVTVRMNGSGHWSIRETTMAQLARRLTGELDRPVIDRTGLAGPYDIDLTFASDAAVLAVPLGDMPPLRTALREQLGLESARAPVEVLVIDRTEEPTES